MNKFVKIFCFIGLISLAFAQIQIQKRIRIGIHGSVGGGGLCSFGDQHDQIITQLNAPSQVYYSFSGSNAMLASFIGNNDIDTLSKLTNNFDVILLMGSGQGAEQNSLSATVASTLVTWVNAGGAVIIGADTVRSITDNSIISALQSIIPVELGSATSCFVPGNSPTFTIYQETHPIFDSVVSSSWSPGTYASWGPANNIGATLLASVTCANSGGNGTAASVKSNIGAGAGRIAYLALPYCGTITYNSGSLRFGTGNQLLHQTIAWVAKAAALCTPACINGGSCVGVNNCSCPNGWQGSICNIPKCTNDCNGHGNCYAPNLCNCSSNWTGLACQTPVCTLPCQNGGVCDSPQHCNCTAGFNGTLCQNSICSPACYNGGNCLGNPNICNCPPLNNGRGWSGAQCLTPNCGTCFNGGTCQTPPACNCTGTNYTGIDCSIFDCTEIGNCQNAGTCIGKNQCNCTSTGWTGQNCTTPICNSPCQNGGRCIFPNTCDCTGTGFTGPTCTSVSCLPACSNNGTCMSFNRCNCTGLLYGGERCTDPLCPTIQCLNGGICGPQPNQCNCAYTSGLWGGPNCSTPNCYPSCKHGGVCAAPNTCNCNGTNYNGTDCNIPLFTFAPPATPSASGTTYEEWLPVGLGEIGTSGLGWDTIIAVLVGGCILCLVCCGVGACLSIMGAKNAKNKQTRRADLELF